MNTQPVPSERRSTRPASLALSSLLVAAVGLLLAAPGLAAQDDFGEDDDFEDDDAGVKLDARAGVAVPMGDLGDATDSGFAPGVGLSFLLSEQVALRADLDMSLLSDVAEDDVDAATDDFFNSDVKLYDYGGALEVNLMDPSSDVFALLSFGAGATTIDPEAPEAPLPPDAEGFGTETNFTLNGGATLGVEATDALGIFVRGTPHAIFVDPEGAGEETVEEELDDIWWNTPIQLGLNLKLR